MKIFFSGMLFALLTAVSLAASEGPVDAPVPAVSTAVPVTDPTVVADHYRQVLARPEFQESGSIDVNSRFREWLSQWFMRLGSHIGEFKNATGVQALTGLLVTIGTVLSIIGLVYTMLRLTRRRGRMDAEPAGEIPGTPTFRAPESYDREIRKAVQAADWHAAWLAAWRQFLSRLENHQLVEADRTRTNYEYLEQLRRKSLPAPGFALLMTMVAEYDRFIYGRQSIGEPEWNFFHRRIGEATLLLHLDDKGAAFRKGAKPDESK